MSCFGQHDETIRACVHCWATRQCKSFRTTHGEEMEAAVLEETLAVMTDEEVALSPLLKILSAPMVLHFDPNASVPPDPASIPAGILPHLD